MTRLIEILISLAIVAALFLVVGLVLPSSRHISESVETNRKMTIVYDTLNNFTPLQGLERARAARSEDGHQALRPGCRRRRAPGLRLQPEVARRRLGQLGNHRQRTRTSASRYAIENNERGNNKRSEFLLKPTGRSGRNVEITQTYDVDYGWNLIGRYGGLYVSRHVGDGMQAEPLAPVQHAGLGAERRLRGQGQQADRTQGGRASCRTSAAWSAPVRSSATTRRSRLR